MRRYLRDTFRLPSLAPRKLAASPMSILSRRVEHALNVAIERSHHNRRVANGDQVSRVAALAMKRGKSVDFTGYWQRYLTN